MTCSDSKDAELIDSERPDVRLRLLDALDHLYGAGILPASRDGYDFRETSNWQRPRVRCLPAIPRPARSLSVGLAGVAAAAVLVGSLVLPGRGTGPVSAQTILARAALAGPSSRQVAHMTYLEQFNLRICIGSLRPSSHHPGSRHAPRTSCVQPAILDDVWATRIAGRDVVVERQSRYQAGQTAATRRANESQSTISTIVEIIQPRSGDVSCMARHIFSGQTSSQRLLSRTSLIIQLLADRSASVPVALAALDGPGVAHHLLGLAHGNMQVVQLRGVRMGAGSRAYALHVSFPATQPFTVCFDTRSYVLRAARSGPWRASLKSAWPGARSHVPSSVRGLFQWIGNALRMPHLRASACDVAVGP